MWAHSYLTKCTCKFPTETHLAARIPLLQGLGARSLSTLRTHVIATCADLAEGVKKAARTIVLLQMAQILKSASNPLGLARTEEIYSYGGGWVGGGSLALLTARPPTALAVVRKKERKKVKERRILCQTRTIRRREISILHPSFPPSSFAATVEIIQKKNKPP